MDGEVAVDACFSAGARSATSNLNKLELRGRFNPEIRSMVMRIPMGATDEAVVEAIDVGLTSRERWKLYQECKKSREKVDA